MAVRNYFHRNTVYLEEKKYNTVSGKLSDRNHEVLHFISKLVIKIKE
jgi:hypothetical protein